jgi:hypothetical protein
MDENEISEMLSKKDIRDIKRSILIDSSIRPTRVFVVAIADYDEKNRSIFIPCFGTPVTQEVYDSVRDGFVLYAYDFYDLGDIPVSYNIDVEDSEWTMDIPLPMSVIRRHLTDEQKSRFSFWKLKFKKSDYRFINVQMLGAYDD